MDSEELLGDAACVPLKKGNTEDGLVVVVVGVEGAELDRCSEDSNCRGSAVSCGFQLSTYLSGSRPRPRVWLLSQL